MLRYTQTSEVSQAASVLPFLADLDAFYPNFSAWYANTVLPGLSSGQDSLLVVREGAHLVGVALGKRSDDETKLRCVRVAPAWQNTGVGLRLIERMFEVLESDKPHVTVAEEMLHAYSRPFVSRYGFVLSDVAKGRYRRGKLEYAFN